MLYPAERRVRNWAREAGVALEENIRIWDERDREDGSRFEEGRHRPAAGSVPA